MKSWKRTGKKRTMKYEPSHYPVPFSFLKDENPLPIKHLDKEKILKIFG